MTDHSFEESARKALAHARAELDSMDDTRLPYAALQLRMAMEALTYERADAMRGFLPTEQIESWQPRDVLRALLEVDSSADKGGALWVGLEETPGVPAKEMTFVGAEHVLSLKTIKKHYDALGSFLHLPSFKQLRAGDSRPLERLRAHCEEVATEVQKAVSATLRNATFGSMYSFVCQRCNTEVKRRLPLKPFDYVITCLSCQAEYHAVSEDGQYFHMSPLKKSISCQTKDCGAVKVLWRHELTPGAEWECDGCQRKYVIGLGAFEKPDVERQ